MRTGEIRKVYLYILLAALLFASMEVVLKLAGSKMDPFQLTFLRFTVGGVLLFPFAMLEMKKRSLKLGSRDLMYLALLGVVCVPVSMVFFQLGVVNSNAATAAVLFSINPLFSIIFAYFIASESFTRSKIIFLMFGLVGIFFIMRPWELQQGNTFIGLAFTLLAALTFGLYTAMGKASVAKMGIIVQTAISFLFGAFVLLIIILITGRPVLQGVAENFALVLYVSLFVTGLGYYAYFMAIKNSDVTTGSLVFFIKPVISPVIAVIVLSERILWNTYVGIVLILIASYLNIKGKRNENRGH